LFLPVFPSRSLKDAYAGRQDRQPELGIALSSLPPFSLAAFWVHVTMIPFPRQPATSPKLLRCSNGEVFEGIMLIVKTPDVVNIPSFS
jgi:hypothetical protein